MGDLLLPFKVKHWRMKVQTFSFLENYISFLLGIFALFLASVSELESLEILKVLHDHKVFSHAFQDAQQKMIQ